MIGQINHIAEQARLTEMRNAAARAAVAAELRGNGRRNRRVWFERRRVLRRAAAA